MGRSISVSACRTAGQVPTGITGPVGSAAAKDDPKVGQQMFNHYVVDANGVKTLSPNATASPGGNDFVILGNAKSQVHARVPYFRQHWQVRHKHAHQQPATVRKC